MEETRKYQEANKPLSYVKKLRKIKLMTPILLGFLLVGIGGYSLGYYRSATEQQTTSIKEEQNPPIDISRLLDTNDSSQYCPTIKEQSDQVHFTSDLLTALAAIEINDAFEYRTENYIFVYNNYHYDVTIQTFANFEGQETQEQYEGMKQVTRIYDNEKETYLALREGVHYELMWHDLDYVQSEVTVKNIGKRKYLIYDSEFPPAGTRSRNYFILSDRKEKLVYVGVTTYNVRDRLDTKITYENDVYRVISYPENFQDFINEIESIIAEVK